MTKTSILILISSILILNGCSLFQPKPEPREVRIVTRPAEIELFQPPLPKPVGLEQVKWHVITPANFEEKIKEIEKLQGGEFVVYAITPKTYENMSYNMQELRRYIREQQEIIIYYRSATTKDVNKDGKVDALDWIELNERLQGDKITVDVQ